MPIETRIDPEQFVITVTAIGRIDYTEAVGAFDEFVKHPDFRPGMHIIWDLCDARLDAKAGDIQQLVTYIRMRTDIRGEGYRTAIVATHSLQRAISSVYQSLAGVLPFEVRIFDNSDKALEWVTEEAR